ncbi:S100 calcium binding protein U isoform X2 [Osmerus mordax]|uniref:S100 calcium binding protein U isoform X2 n=1 Tax=Osmerus mordax TaxID=8014 RepID=UPI00351036FF
MEAAIQTMVTVFVKSSKGKENLGGKDFQNLVKNKLGNILTDADSSEAVTGMRKGLDENHDGKVSFEEYMKLIGYLATSLSKQCSDANKAPASANEAPSTAKEAPAAASPAPPAKEKDEEKQEEKKEGEQPQAAVATVEEVKEENQEEEKEEKKDEEVEEEEAAPAEVEKTS